MLLFIYLYVFKMCLIDGCGGLYFCALRACHELNINGKLFESRTGAMQNATSVRPIRISRDLAATKYVEWSGRQDFEPHQELVLNTKSEESTCLSKKFSGDVHVAFCIDKYALIGLHITLASALRNFSHKRTMIIHLVHEDLDAEALGSIRRTIERSGRRVLLRCSHLNAAIFRHLDAFVGGYMAYARLLLPRVIDASRLIYLDADLIVGVDLAELYEQDLAGKPLGAVSWHSRASAHDSRLFLELGRDMSEPYFNSGVLLIDADKWRQEALTDKVLAKGDELTGKLISHDQSLINVCFEGKIQRIPRKFNTPVTPRRRALDVDKVKDRVLHLVARPKPWDPLGRLNGQHQHYLNYLPLTDLNSAVLKNRYTHTYLFTILRSFRAYAKCLLRQT